MGERSIPSQERLPPDSENRKKEEDMQEQDIRLLMEITPERESLVDLMRGVKLQRTKTTKAGPLLYCSSYPVWNTLQAMAANRQLENKKPQRGTTEAQAKLNARKAQQKLEAIINANFGPGDLLVTCTYPDGGQPVDEEQARKDMRNYLARLKRLCRRRGAPDPAYVYTTEVTQSNRWGTRYHHHMILKADVSRAEAEDCWFRSARGICNTRSAQKLKEGLTGWAKYISKQTCSGTPSVSRQAAATSLGEGGLSSRPEGSSSGGAGTAQAVTEGVKRHRRWCASKGLIVPEPTTADKKLSPRRVEKIAKEIVRDPREARAMLEKVYPGYEVLELDVRTSAWVSGAYVYAIMTRKEESRCLSPTTLAAGTVRRAM